MNEIELKPCPFCGKNPFVLESNSGWRVCCTQFHSCLVNPKTKEYRNKKDAIKAWNRRVTDDKPRKD